MIRLFLLILMLFMAGNSFATSLYFYFSTPQAAIDGCDARHADNPTSGACVGNNSYSGDGMCSSGGNYLRYTNTPYYNYNYIGCVSGFSACPISGQTRDSTGACVAPPPSCSAGQLSSNVIDTSFGGTTVSRIGTFVVSHNGCEAECEDDGVLSTTADSKTYQHITCKLTGQPLPPDDSPVPLDDTPTPPVDTINADPGCVVGKDNNGKVIETCDTKPDSNCGTVNGQSVCYDSEAVKINDEVIKKTDAKNCGTVNGEISCVVPKSEADYCVLNGNNEVCFNSKVVKNETKQVVTNPDGSVTTTETKDTNLKSDKPVTKTSVKNPDGSETITTQGTEKGDLDSSALSAIADNTQITASNTSEIAGHSKDISDNTKGILDGFTDFSQVPEGNDGYDQSPIVFDGLDSKLDADRDEFEGFVNQVNPMKAYYEANPFSAAFSSMLPSDTSCSGGIHTTFLGKSFDLEPCEKLSPLREILAWFFAVMTAWQIINMTSKAIVRF